MDPLGWATKNNKDATNTWIWSPSHHPNRTVTADKDEYPNIAPGAQTSSELEAKGGMEDETKFQTQSTNEFWANNYPSDTT